MEDRTFSYEGQEFFIKAPSAMVIREADWVYSKMYTKALIEGIPTSSEMQDILKKRGIIGPEYDDRAVELSTMLSDKLERMIMADDPVEKKLLAEEAANIRNDIFLWNQRLNGPMANTCEQMADDARLESITSSIVVDKDGNNIWKNHDDFISSDKSDLTATAKFEVMLYLQGLESDFLDTVPENEVMKELEYQEANKAVVEKKSNKKGNKSKKAKSSKKVEKEV